MFSRVLHPCALARLLVAQVVEAGAAAVDATAGNGEDTAFLAGLVGDGGRVYAYDIQPAAIAATRRRLEQENLLPRVVLCLAGHEHMAEQVPAPVRAVMFNLGYLPGGDHRVVTRPETTLAALTQALELLQPGGIMTVAVYSGHPGGREERDAVAGWLGSLDRHRFALLHCGFAKVRGSAPELFAVEKGNEPAGRIFRSDREVMSKRVKTGRCHD